ncbi:hypothetical protein COMNV_00655 [Commensalibacter sp. Nvir]|uniref:hypothetical protein n=1 Tax=Commensalibacter sp. Nvir TaxID=3069817 RepID=UPI002D282235|nr:hypothetical protein COMNV_00655 [Commensalibacter sp. Nvir]
MYEIEILSLLFDSDWYLDVYKDVAEAKSDPLDHYLSYGYKEKRNPNRYFDTNFYATAYPDVMASGLNPFIHYILYGASEGRLPRSPHQKTNTYVRNFTIREAKTEKHENDLSLNYPQPSVIENDKVKITNGSSLAKTGTKAKNMKDELLHSVKSTKGKTRLDTSNTVPIRSISSLKKTNKNLEL